MAPEFRSGFQLSLPVFSPQAPPHPQILPAAHFLNASTVCPESHKTSLSPLSGSSAKQPLIKDRLDTRLRILQCLCFFRRKEKLASSIRRIRLSLKIPFRLQACRPSRRSSFIDLKVSRTSVWVIPGLWRTRWIKSNSAVPIPSSFMV